MSIDFHIHSHFSIDSIIVPKVLVKIAKKQGLNGVAVTDHNTIKGGMMTKKINPYTDFTVIVGSEIKTQLGEIIGLFLNTEILSTNPFNVLDEIRAQGGISLIPHPYRAILRSEQIPVDVIAKSDLIEAFNFRTRAKSNQDAFKLASKMRKPMVAGSDAHFYGELGRARTLVEPYIDEEELRKNLLQGKIKANTIEGTFSSAIPYILCSGFYNRIRKIRMVFESNL